jgi:dolichol-phosphate mannosyltransferase
MIAYTRVQIIKLLKIDFIRFCIVGGTGLTINLIILVLLSKVFGVGIFVAQLIGAEIALFSNFMIHDAWTYKHHRVEKKKHHMFVQFHLTTWPAILGSALMVTLFEKLFNFSDIVSLAISSLITLLWNFFWSKYVIWRKVTDKEVTSPGL